MRNSICLLAFLVWVFTAGTSVAQSSVADLSPKQFFAQVAANWKKLNASTDLPGVDIPKKGTAFLPIRELIRGQDEISVDNALAKMPGHLKSGNLSWSGEKKRYLFHSDAGRSLVPLNDPVRVIRGPDGYVIEDGHHDVFLSLFLGAKSVAVHVVEDHHEMSRESFFQMLKSRRKVYLAADAHELARELPDMLKVNDNPERYLATLLAMKVKLKRDAEGLKVMKVSGKGTAVWMKLDGSVPFIEFFIAEVLRESGIRYESSWGTKIPRKAVEQARAALLEAQARGELPRSNVVPIISSLEAAALFSVDPAHTETFLIGLQLSAHSSLQCHQLLRL